MNVIRDMTEVRKIEDYYDIREKIGEGRFATVYRVGMERGLEGSAWIRRRCRSAP